MTGRHRAWAVVLAAGLGAVFTPPAAGTTGAASTFTISGFGDGSTGFCTPPDTNGNSVCPTLREAVNQANTQTNDPTIYLGPGTYQLGNPAGQLNLARAMNIVGAGPGPPNGTTIEQTDGRNRVLQVDGTSTLSEVAVTGGSYVPPWSSGRTVYGGGLLVLGALTLENSLISGNQAVGAAGQTTGEPGDAAVGGGIDYGSTAAAGSVILNSTITGNTAVGGLGGPGGQSGGAADGGGIAYQGSGPLLIQNSIVSSNAATGGGGGGGAGAGGTGGSGQGGGIFNPGEVTVLGSTIEGNTASGGAQGPGPPSVPHSGGLGDGGGIFSQATTDRVVNSTIFGNSAQGGAAVPGGTAGAGYGGGLLDEGPSASLTLASVTLDANQAASAGGNLDVNVGVAPPSPFTIHDTIVAGGSPNNCEVTTPPSSDSYNLEDDSADSCGLRPASNDLVGANPELPNSLAEYGGPTPTLAPAPGSPALGAGGSCVDPSSTPPNQPLGTDQRGEPRTARCDIGAFQAQPPASVARPSISGFLARGQTLICSQGAWTGDGVFTYAFTWLRDGVPIPGTTTNTYVIGPADAGRALACQVTATFYGSTIAASPFVIAQAYPVITVLKVTSTPTAVTVSLGCRGDDGQRCIGRLTVAVAEKRLGGVIVSLSPPAARSPGVILGQHAYSIRARHVGTIQIALEPKVGRLLRRFRQIPALLSVTQTTALGTGPVTSRSVKIRPYRRRHSR